MILPGSETDIYCLRSPPTGSRQVLYFNTPKNKNVIPLLEYSLCDTSVWEQPTKIPKVLLACVTRLILYEPHSPWLFICWRLYLMAQNIGQLRVRYVSYLGAQVQLKFASLLLILGITERHSSIHSIPLTICSKEICAMKYLTYIHPNKLSNLGLMLNKKCAKDSLYHYFSIGSCRQWLI